MVDGRVELIRFVADVVPAKTRLRRRKERVLVPDMCTLVEKPVLEGKKASKRQPDRHTQTNMIVRVDHVPRLCVEVEQFLAPDPLTASAFMKFRQALIKVSNQCNKGTFPYDAYVVDSLTSIAMASQRMVMVNSSKVGQNPQIQHWGALLNEILNVVTLIRSLPIIVFVLAHETVFTSDDEKIVQIAISGHKLPGQITRLFNEIWYLRCKPLGGGGQELYIQTVPTSSITCRSGRGLPTGTRYATIDKKGKPTDSVGLCELLDMIKRDYSSKKATEEIN